MPLTTAAGRAGWGSSFSRTFEQRLRQARLLPRTIRLYVGHMDRLRKWCDEERSLDDITTVLDYAETLPQTYASLNAFVNAYKKWWTVSGRKGPCPAECVRLPGRPKMECKAIEKSEVEALIEAARRQGAKPYAVCCLLYYAGLRNMECASLPRNAPKDGWLYIMGKGAQPRVVPIHGVLQEALGRLPEEESVWMFPGRGGAHVSPNTINTYVKIAAAVAGLEHITPHVLRHTFAATMNDTFGDLRGTAELMGHSRSSIAITAGYTRTTKQKAIELVGGL